MQQFSNNGDTIVAPATAAGEGGLSPGPLSEGEGREFVDATGFVK